MAVPEKFTSLDAIRREKERLKLARALHGERVQRHWRDVADPERRRHLIWSSVRDLFPRDQATWQDLFAEGGKWAASSMAFRSRKVRNRFFWLGLSMALPLIIRRMDPDRISHLADELKVSMDRIRERFGKGRSEQRP